VLQINENRVFIPLLLLKKPAQTDHPELTSTMQDTDAETSYGNVTLPFDAWNTIFDQLTAVNRGLRSVALAFVAQASKELNSLCNKYREQSGIGPSNLKPHMFHRYFGTEGLLHLMKYAHENGCEWGNEDACHFSAANGNLECLKYAHDNGCEW
jgi:hypothetical protein